MGMSHILSAGTGDTVLGIWECGSSSAGQLQWDGKLRWDWETEAQLNAQTLQETRSGQNQLYWWGLRGKHGLPESSTKLEGSDCGQVKGTWQERPRGMWQVGVQGPLRRVHLPPGVSALCWAAQAWPPLANKGHRSGALVHVRRC